MTNKTDTMPDEVILRLQQGDEQAFSLIYDKYSPALYGLISRIVQDEDLASDVLQDSFVKIWKSAPGFNSDKGSFFTWMLNICRNSAIDVLRKVKKEREYKIQMGSDDVSMENHSAIRTDHIGMQDLIDKLPEEQRLMIEYIYFRGYTQQEVADELDIPLGTVKTRARSAVLGLKGYFVLILLMWILKNT